MGVVLLGARKFEKKNIASQNTAKDVCFLSISKLRDNF